MWGIVVLAGLFYVGGQYVASEPQRIEQEVEANREITVSGRGEVTARPDIATITVGVTTGRQKTAAAAMDLLAERINAVVASVQKEGIEEKDIKTTDLSVNPLYDFTDGQRRETGFEATESVQVKIRNLDSIGDVVSSATSQGANQTGGISFAIDEPESLQLAAQEKAIENARNNAEQLAKALDVKLGRVKSFSASIDSPEGPPVFARAELGSLALDEVASPEVLSGSQDVHATVSVTFELN